MALAEWNDARLDDLQQEVVAMRQVAAEVRVMTARVEDFKRDTSARLENVQREMRDGFIAVHHTLEVRDQREEVAAQERALRRRRSLTYLLSGLGALGSVAAVLEVLASLRVF